MSHWTSSNTDAFVHAIATDFIAQIEDRLEDEGINRQKFARLLKVSPGRVSQTLNDPASFNLRTIVNYARVLGMKVSILAYDDGDSSNDKGPISAEVFTACWKHNGRPQDLSMFSAGAPASNYNQRVWRAREVPQEAIEHGDIPSLGVRSWFIPQELGDSKSLRQGANE
jgi:hypothetical protein